MHAKHNHRSTQALKSPTSTQEMSGCPENIRIYCNTATVSSLFSVDLVNGYPRRIRCLATDFQAHPTHCHHDRQCRESFCPPFSTCLPACWLNWGKRALQGIWAKLRSQDCLVVCQHTLCRQELLRIQLLLDVDHNSKLKSALLNWLITVVTKMYALIGSKGYFVREGCF